MTTERMQAPRASRARQTGRILALGAALALPDGRAARAQSLSEGMQGVWTTGSIAACPASSYVWSGSGDEVRFRDHAGRVDVEHVVSRRPDGFTSLSVESASVPPGTRWDYQLLQPGVFQVRNLSGGYGFVLSRCPHQAGDPPQPAPPGTGCPGGADCGDAPGATDAFLDPVTLTRVEVLLVQDALIWTGRYVNLKDGVWGKATVDALRAWRQANALPPAVSLRPAEMATLLGQAVASKAALRWTVMVDPDSGSTIGVPLALVSAHPGTGGTEYTGDNGVGLAPQHYPATIEAIRVKLDDMGRGGDVQRLVYRLDKPDRQVLSFDSTDGASVYVRLDRTADNWCGFLARVRHGVASYNSLITAFSADFDATGRLPPSVDGGSAPQLFALLTQQTPAAARPSVQPAAYTPGSRSAEEALWRGSQTMLRPRLNAALETAPSETPIAWTDEASGISAELVVHPANPIRPLPCRAFSFTVRQADTAVLVTGTRCRRAAGLWESNGAEDSLTALPTAPAVQQAVQPALVPATVPLPGPDTLVRALQLNLHRLAYFDGASDGLMSAALRAAVISFQQDENVAVTGEPTSATEDLSEAAVARIPPPGSCPGSVSRDATVVCGHVR